MSFTGYWQNRSRLTNFFSRVEIASGCWRWIGGVNGRGYGMFNGKSSHRFTYSWFVAPIPEGLVIDHLCLNKLCVNPAHLEAVTDLENRRRAAALRTHCRHGHEYTPENTGIQRVNGRPYRDCRACHRAKQTAYLQRLGPERQKAMRRRQRKAA